MTRPLPTFEAASYRLTARCIFRKYLLTPTPEVTEAIGFWLGVTAQRHGIEVHAWMTMSNHIHLDVTDPNRALSAFLQDFKGTLAKVVNVLWGRIENLWDTRGTGRQEVTTYEDALDGMVYTFMNPTRAGLVSHPNAWPGSCSKLSDLGATRCRTYTFKKPRRFLRSEEQGSHIPDEITWSLTPHPLGASNPEQFVKDIKARVAKQLKEKQEQVKRDGGRFKGAAAATQLNYWDAPKTPAPKGETRPLVAARDKKRRQALINEYRAFATAHEAARQSWLEGHEVAFPAGTNKMRAYPRVTLKSRAGPAPKKRAA